MQDAVRIYRLTEYMKHIFGMAKSNLDLRGAKSPKLELDYLRLVYAVKEYRRKCIVAKGYLVVLGPKIKKVCDRWETKYHAGGCVEVIVKELPPDSRGAIEQEKQKNKQGMVRGALGMHVGNRSLALLGEKAAEDALRKHILEREPSVRKEDSGHGRFPFDIKWDFYGKVP